MKEISLAFSPCPNDTFIFHAMVNGLVDTHGINFKSYLDDIESLNQKAFSKTYQISKLSFYAYIELMDNYAILDSGSALGFGCGPLVVARSEDIDINRSRVAVPGQYTTANLLFRLRYPAAKNITYTRFDDIMPGIERGEFDAGVIIHEGRFVFLDHDLLKIIDLGEWWETETGLPIPLGCIAVRRDPELLAQKILFESVIKDSLVYARENRDASREYIKANAQELDDEVIDSHIRLYVNDFSLSLGDEGREAVDVLIKMVKGRGLS